MGILIVVDGNKIEGTDKHNVSGNATNPVAPPPTVVTAENQNFVSCSE